MKIQTFIEKIKACKKLTTTYYSGRHRKTSLYELREDGNVYEKAEGVAWWSNCGHISRPDHLKEAIYPELITSSYPTEKRAEQQEQSLF